MKKNEATIEKSEQNTNEKAMTHEQINVLKQEKRKAQAELDELQGKTTSGKIICVLAFLGIFAVCMGVFLGLVKMNVGNFAADVLAPVIGEVPIVRNILPTDLQKKSPNEIKAEKQDAADAKAAKKTADAAALKQADEKAAADKALAKQKAKEAAAAKRALAKQKSAEKKAAAAQARSDKKDKEAAALKDYVDTYSQMKPKVAAAVFDNMMTDQSDLVVKILKNMKADSRAAIISNMSVANASQVTVMMEQP